MSPEVQDALYGATTVTLKQPKIGNVIWPDRAKTLGDVHGTFPVEKSSELELRVKIIAFLGELDNNLTVEEVLEDLRDFSVDDLNSLKNIPVEHNDV